MDDGDVGQRETRDGIGFDAGERLFGEARMMVELEPGHRGAVILASHQPGERGDGARAGRARRKVREQRGGIERLGLDRDHPPLIGGRKATSSPSSSTRLPRIISSLTAMRTDASSSSGRSAAEPCPAARRYRGCRAAPGRPARRP